MPETDEPYTVKRLAAEAELAASTITRWLEAGRIRGAQAFPGSPWRIPAAEARRVIACAKGEGPATPRARA